MEKSDVLTVLRALRQARGLRQIDVSRETGVSTGKLSMLERGLIEPDPRTLKALADFFGVPPEKLLEPFNPAEAYALLGGRR